MNTLSKAMLLAASAAAMAAQDRSRFEPQPAASYPAHQTAGNVTIGVEAYEDGEKLKRAFGKTDPSKYGVVPVLVVIDNHSDHALQLERMRVELIAASGQKADPVPAEDIQKTARVKPPRVGGPGPIPGIRRGPRKPRDNWEISARAFTAPAVAAAATASGFFYFRVPKDQVPGARLYIAGIRDARTAQELLYFEIPLTEDNKP
jgi:hypothetical protein